MKPDGAEEKTKVGKSGFIVTWFGDILVQVEAEGGGPVRGVTVKASRLKEAKLDPRYTNFAEEVTDEYGQATIAVRVQDPTWSSLTQQFHLDVEKQTSLTGVSTPLYTKRNSLRVSGSTHPEVEGVYVPVQNEECNGMPRYKCQDCSQTAFLTRLPSNQASRWHIDNVGDCAYSPTHYIYVIGYSITGAPRDPTSADLLWNDFTEPQNVVGGVQTRNEDINVVSHSVYHTFEPASADITVRHLGQGVLDFSDATARIVSGTVSHDAFGAAYFAADCPHTTSEDPTDCMCPVDGAEVFIKRESGAVESVVLNNGKFATAVLWGETVTIGLRTYKGTNGDVPHSFSVTYKAKSATVQEGTEPTFEYTADEDAEVHFLDISTQTLSATYVVGEDRAAAEYVNGVPVVAKVARCGWERPAWAVRGVATFTLGAAVVEVRALSDGEVLEAKYYHPPGGFGGAEDCDLLGRAVMVSGTGDDSTMLRGCRAKVPEVAVCNSSALVTNCQTPKRPCATMDKTYVDELPEKRKFDVDLSILGTGSNATDATNASSPVEFLIASPLCLKSVSAAAARGTTLQSLLTHDGERESQYAFASQENLLMAPPQPKPDGRKPYGEACTDNTNAVFREGDAVDLGFMLVEREPNCGDVGMYPWDLGNLCSGYIDTPPSADLPIAIRVADGVSRTESSAAYPTRQNAWPADRRTVDITKCRPHGCDLGEVPTPMDWELAFNISVASSETFGSWKSIIHVTGATSNDLERYPGVWFRWDKKLCVFQTNNEPLTIYTMTMACSSTGFEAGQTYDVRVTNVNSKLTLYVNGKIDGEPVEGSSTYVPSTRVGKLMVGWDVGGLYPSVNAIISDARFVDLTDKPFEHIMTAGAPNTFSPFSLELSVEFTRQFDAAKILFVRHALVVGVTPDEVPQVWTVATNPTLIFLILHDPPGGGSFATLTEGSTISTSMAIDGSHAAELEDSWQVGASVGGGVDMKAGAGIGVFAIKNVASVGADVGFTYSNTPTDVSVSRSTSRHFDIGISFAAAISTSDSPYIPGEPSDVIVGGGANLRFIQSIEVYATASGDGLCLGGLTTQQFLPEQISTYVLSVYEIEKTIERLGAALTDPNTKMEAKSGVPDPRKDLVKQIENWQTVLRNYRAAKVRDQAESVAEQLSLELSSLEANFQSFLDDAVKNGNDKQFSAFLSHGLSKLEEHGSPFLGTGKREGTEMPPSIEGQAGAGEVGSSENAAVETRERLSYYEADVLDRVNSAFAECVLTVDFVEPGNKQARLCDVYKDIRQKIELKKSALFGICDFANDCCVDDSGVCNCRKESKVCDGSEPQCAPVDHFCKRDRYREGKEVIGAFDALHDTTQFITFSGTNGLEFSWNIAESRGTELSSTHEAVSSDAIGGSVGFGANLGRRRLEASSSKGVPGYAYPTSGRVLAVSKKLLEVTPDALEEKRRRLAAEYGPATREDAISQAVAKINASPEPESVSNPCRRRLDGLDMSVEEQRRLGVTACASFEGGTSVSYAVSLSRAVGKGADHTRSIDVSLKDNNVRDYYALRISQDAIYGTPIFTTMGGRSSCVGETGTTRRDSRVIIKEIKPLCSESDPATGYPGSPLCASKLDCECKDLKPGKDALFSVVLENLSPWGRGTAVGYLLRATQVGLTAWDSGKYARDFTGPSKVGCEPGDLGSLSIKTMDNQNLRTPGGVKFWPLAYGQSEVRIKVSRPANLAPQCFDFTNLELELVSICEDTDWDAVQDMYQYKVSMDEKTGAVSVVHPKLVGRPVGTACAGGVTLDATSTSVTDTTYQGDGKWCYSDLNLAVGCTASPAACWTTCSTKVADLNKIKDVSMAAAVAQGCPISFIQQTDDKGEKFKCSPVDGPFELKAIDWEEVTGQCRCQNKCECTVKDLYSYDVTKNKDDPGYKNRTTITHLLTEDSLNYPPTNKDGKNASCGLYTFTGASKANGPDTSRKTFDVSWKNEVRGCTYPNAENYNPLATVDDDKCIFAKLGCKYKAATNFDSNADKNDGKCVFPSVTIQGKFCLYGDLSNQPNTMDTLKAKIAAITKVNVSDITIIQGTGGCTRRLQDSLLSGRILQTSFRYVYQIKTEDTRVGAVLGVLSTDLQTALEDLDLTVVSEDPPQLVDSCTECTDNYQCEPGFVCEFGSGGGTRKLRFGNTRQSGCCRAL